MKGEIEEKYWFPVVGHRYIAESSSLASPTYVVNYCQATGDKYGNKEQSYHVLSFFQWQSHAFTKHDDLYG